MRTVSITIWAVSLSIAASFPVAAQSGWAQFGRSLGNANDSTRQQILFNEAAIQAAELNYLMESNRGLRLENQRLDVQKRWQRFLTDIWAGIGMSPEEASAIASTYELNNQQAAVNLRVKTNPEQAVKDAVAAYRGYNYQLANQLLVAIQIAGSTTPKHASDPSWRDRIDQLVAANTRDVTASPRLYEVPSGTNSAALAGQTAILDDARAAIANGIPAGHALVFYGVDSNRTADVVVTAAQGAPTNTLQGVVVLFVGISSDLPRVRRAIEPTGATLRFATM